MNENETNLLPFLKDFIEWREKINPDPFWEGQRFARVHNAALREVEKGYKEGLRNGPKMYWDAAKRISEEMNKISEEEYKDGKL